MIHTHTKFAPLDFINKKMKGKNGFFTQTEHPLFIFEEILKGTFQLSIEHSIFRLEFMSVYVAALLF